jgi:DNA repair protein RadC
MNRLENEVVATYHVDQMSSDDDAIIAHALAILHRRMKRPGAYMTSPQVVKNFLSLKLAELEHEVFVCLWLDAQNQVIEYQEIFRGTITSTSVYPREVVKLALARNASGAIIAHNHPSGNAEASQADRWLTDQLKAALGLVDVRIIDHIIIAGTDSVSFAERGWI